MADLAEQSKTGFAGLRSDIAALSFVPRGEYVIETRAMADQIKSTHALAMWALGGVVGTPVVAIVIAVVMRTA